MSLEHSPGRQRERAAFTVSEFCEAHRVSRSQLYKMWNEGRGPKTMDIGTKRLITTESAAAWRRQLEAQTAALRARDGEAA